MAVELQEPAVESAMTFPGLDSEPEPPECWIADLPGEAVECFRAADEDGYSRQQRLTAGATLVPEALEAPEVPERVLPLLTVAAPMLDEADTVGLIGEYVGRICDGVQGRPLYVVRARVTVAASCPDAPDRVAVP